MVSLVVAGGSLTQRSLNSVSWPSKLAAWQINKKTANSGNFRASVRFYQQINPHQYCWI